MYNIVIFCIFLSATMKSNKEDETAIKRFDCTLLSKFDIIFHFLTMGALLDEQIGKIEGLNSRFCST